MNCPIFRETDERIDVSRQHSTSTQYHLAGTTAGEVCDAAITRYMRELFGQMPETST